MTTIKTQTPCTLCGLAVKVSTATSKEIFCCQGCKMVHAMLMESDQYKDTRDFKDTDLYKQCVAAGIIPDTSKENPASSGRIPEPPARELSGTDTEVEVSGEVEAPIDAGNFLTLNLQIQNMWCPACAWLIETTLTRSKGVINASCNFSSDRGSVVYDPVKTSPDKIYAAIEKLGYPSADIDQTPQKNRKEFIRICVTLFLTMNVMMLSWAIYSGFFIELSPHSVQLLAWPVFLMATVVVFYGGYPIHKRALAGITSGWPGMETLISTGSFLTYTYSLFQFYRGSIHLYFDAASMLILLILTGKMLEQSAKNKIAEGLWKFFSLVPQKVRIVQKSFPGDAMSP